MLFFLWSISIAKSHHSQKDRALEHRWNTLKSSQILPAQVFVGSIPVCHRNFFGQTPSTVTKTWNTYAVLGFCHFHQHFVQTH